MIKRKSQCTPLTKRELLSLLDTIQGGSDTGKKLLYKYIVQPEFTKRKAFHCG